MSNKTQVLLKTVKIVKYLLQEEKKKTYSANNRRWNKQLIFRGRFDFIRKREREKDKREEDRKREKSKWGWAEKSLRISKEAATIPKRHIKTT